MPQSSSLHRPGTFPPEIPSVPDPQPEIPPPNPAQPELPEPTEEPGMPADPRAPEITPDPGMPEVPPVPEQVARRSRHATYCHAACFLIFHKPQPRVHAIKPHGIFLPDRVARNTLEQVPGPDRRSLS